ncbi:MAG: hypothetical protein J5601_01955, partial [Elusimicrobiaceae bacterium]|nr:hypothetical protein [Elusimicrobiaceae bacterium]
MNKLLSLLVSIALLFTQLAPLAQAAEAGSTIQSMLESSGDPGWMDAGQVSALIKYLKAHTEEITEHKTVIEEGYERIRTYCGNVLESGRVKIGNEKEYPLCNAVYGIQHDLRDLLGKDQSSTTYLPD